MSKPGRYRDAFVERLASVLYGEAATTRQRYFEEWLERFPFICERCNINEFSVSTDEVGEDDLILCGKCRKG